MYSIINFNKKDYQTLIKNIETSRGYICFIDSKNNKGVVNKRYKNYLDMKQVLYTARPPHIPNTSIYTYLLPEWITEAKIENLYEKHGVQNDYYLEKQLVSEEIKGAKVFTHQAIPIECTIFDDSIEVDTQLERLNRSCLSDKFIMHNHRRFLLIPFIAKYNDNYVEPIIIANVYDIGIITIQLIISFEHNKVIELSESPPREITFTEIHFNKTKDNYKIDDFWDKEVKKNITADEIMVFYEKQIALLSRTDLFYNPNNRPISWVFGDFELNKYDNHQEFIERYKRLYASHLTNGVKEVIERKTDKEIDQLLDNSSITKNKELCYFCTPTSSIVSIGYSAIQKKAEQSLKEDEQVSKSNEIYNEHLNSIFKSQTLMAMLDYLRFYELTFIKRYFLIKLLNEISLDTYKTLRDYNSVKKNLNFIKLQYDEEILFFTEGSPKELYKSILEKSNVHNLLTKVEDLIKNIREDVTNSRDLEIKQNETLILILTSLLTILLGYNGIKLIVSDVWGNLPFLGHFVS